MIYGGTFPPLGQDYRVGSPPLSFFDQQGRDIALRVFGDGPIHDEREALVEMYLDYEPRHRSLGIPPVGEAAIREWLDAILDGYCVLAWDDDRVVGQAVLVNGDEKGYELAIFVHPDYHGAGIGTRLTEALLSYGREQGVRAVWLLVERENDLAVNLYREVGFVVTDDQGPDVEMGVDLRPA
jgi:ribosomal protein S18 acetylase RimI-like enzyme